MPRRIVTPENLRAAAGILRQHALARGTYATTPQGVAVEPLSDAAKCFCALGALWRAAGHRPEPHLLWGEENLLHHLFSECCPNYSEKVTQDKEYFITDYSDTSGKEEVIALLQAMADKLEGTSHAATS